ncbi:MAG: efflux RND transporter periplasmic adaptor subunit [Candidatus Hydrogenedentes bacterium]|nr:efflux RND transporter periplasmic adaptor subunit [Candidatus Hydrogenedentota bacterium]
MRPLRFATGLALILSANVTSMSLAQGPGSGPPPPPEVAVVTVQPVTVPVAYEFVGVTEASKLVEVRARIQGFLETRDFSEGAYIEQGAKLFTIDPRSFQADQQIAVARVEQAETRLNLAGQEVERLRSVKVPGAIAETDLDQALAEQADAAASLRLAKAQLAKAELELSYTTVEAPLTGFIGKAEKEIGSLVDASANSLLTVMRQVDPIYVSFQVSERDYLRYEREVRDNEIVLADGIDAPYLEVTLLDGSVYPEKGVIDFESAAIDVQTGTVELRATLPNADKQLKAGQFVNVHIRGYVRPDTLTVPQRAVSQSPQGSYVYRVDDSNTAQFQIIKPGPWAADDWIVSNGLAAGDRVVVEGLVKVQPGITVNPVPYTAQENAEAAE